MKGGRAGSRSSPVGSSEPVGELGQTAILFDNFAAIQQDKRDQQRELEAAELTARHCLSQASTQMFLYLRNKYYRELDLTFPDIVRTHMVLSNLYFLITGQNLNIPFVPEKSWVQEVHCLEDMEYSPDIAGWAAVRSMPIDNAPRSRKKPLKKKSSE